MGEGRSVTTEMLVGDTSRRGPARSKGVLAIGEIREGYGREIVMFVCDESIFFSLIVVLLTGKLSVDIGELRWLRELSLQSNLLKGPSFVDVSLHSLCVIAVRSWFSFV